MKKNFLIYIHIFLASFLFVACDKNGDDNNEPPVIIESQADPALVSLLENTNWETKQVAPGIVWKYHHFTELLNSRQYITIFDIDLNNTNITIEIPHVTSGFIRTSTAAVENDADVAFNGSYFDTSTGGSTVHFKVDGTLINRTRSGFQAFRENGAFIITHTGNTEIIPRPSGGWVTVNAYSETVLAGGPLLIDKGQKVSQLDEGFNTLRHPRTVMGITRDNHLIVVVVDGRSSQSLGLNTMDLSELMLALGCISAVNMDGGGSSTAWVKGEGIVNHPTDNGRFDHQGERGVATVFTVKAH